MCASGNLLSQSAQDKELTQRRFDTLAGPQEIIEMMIRIYPWQLEIIEMMIRIYPWQEEIISPNLLHLTARGTDPASEATQV